MSLAKTFPAPVLETILTGLSVLFIDGAAGDIAAARQAAAEMLDDYNPRTRFELALAASIVSFTFQALDALAQAAAPNIPMTRILRLRSGAVSLSRESEKAERRLMALQKARQQNPPAEIQHEIDQPEPAQPEPAQQQPANPGPSQPEPPPATLGITAPSPIRIRSEQDRQQALRIAANIKRAEAMFAAKSSAPQPTDDAPRNAAPGHQGPTQAPTQAHIR